MTDDTIKLDPDLLTEIRELVGAMEFETIDHTTDARRSLVQRAAERREYELRGAWRAGYDYVHVYRPEPDDLLGPLDAVQERVIYHPDILIPSNDASPDDRTGGRYIYTCDLTSVPDDVLRAAIRGDLDPEEWDA